MSALKFLPEGYEDAHSDQINDNVTKVQPESHISPHRNQTWNQPVTYCKHEKM